MKSLFANYLQFREESSAEPVMPKVKLSKDSEFKPFVVDKNSHSNLREIIKAFNNSSKVGTGYTTIDKSKGEHEPLLKKKTLYLVGGAVRDHLKSKTPKNYDLVTDATPDEIKMILDKAETKFTEVKPQTHLADKKYKNLPEQGDKNKIYYASRWDKQGKEIEITVEIKGEKFVISTLSKHSKSKNIVPDKALPVAGLADDASNRDFTINSMYIKLANHDGENNELTDPHGGIHHLKKSEIKLIGDLKDKLEEDPTIAMKYIKMLNKYGSATEMPDDHKELIKNHQGFADLPKSLLRFNYLDGLENIDVDPRRYLDAYKNTGLLNYIVPDYDATDDYHPELKNDRWLSTAWMMRHKSPDIVFHKLRNSGWSQNESHDIAYLVKLYHWATKNYHDPYDIYDLAKAKTGISKSKIREWIEMVEIDTPEVQALYDMDTSDLYPYVTNEYGGRMINPTYSRVLGKPPKSEQFESIARWLYAHKWKNTVGKHNLDID